MFFSKEDGTAESPHNLLIAKISYNIFVLKEKGAHTLDLYFTKKQPNKIHIDPEGNAPCCKSDARILTRSL